jgi:hypothetical protein
VNTLEHLTAGWIPLLDLKFIEETKALSRYPGFQFPAQHGESSIWPALSCGCNVSLPLHTDQDYFISAVCTHTKENTGNRVLQYFCFPTLGKCVPMRNGSILLFNPQVPHCLSSPCRDTDMVYAMSAYLKSLVVAGNSNSVGTEAGARECVNHTLE